MAAQSDKTRCAAGTFTRTAPALPKSIAILHLRSNVRPLGGASCDSVLHPVFLLVFLGAVQGVQIKSVPPGQKWPGFSFALHLLKVQGFCFALLQYSPHTNIYSAFCAVNATIPHTAQNSAQGFTGAFPAIRLFCRRCVAGASAYTAPAAPRWSVSQRRNTSSTYQIPAPHRTLYSSAQTADYTNLTGSRCFPRPAACNLAPVNSQGAPGQSGTPHPAGQSSSRGNAAGGAEPLAASAGSLFGLSPDSQ